MEQVRQQAIIQSQQNQNMNGFYKMALIKSMKASGETRETLKRSKKAILLFGEQKDNRQAI